MTQKQVDLYDIYVIYPSGVFGGVLDLSGAPGGANGPFPQCRALFELWQ